MIAMSLAEVAELTGGTVHADAPPAQIRVDGLIVTDSREAVPGSLYVARVGEHADGHQFTGDAAARGAVAALTSRVVDELPCVVVSDVQEAFATLARCIVDRAVAGPAAMTVIGITGSAGKTSTKDLLGHVLATAGEVVAPVGSYNSEVGVPLTVARVTERTRFLVAEMGADGPGHIDYLTRIAPPRIGIVLNVGVAHLGNFASRDEIADTKAALVRSLPGDGLAILNAEDPLVAAMAKESPARVQLVGSGGEVHASGIRLVGGRAHFLLHTPVGEREVRLGVHGEHQVGNSLAVIAAALACGLDLDDIVAALASARPVSRWRMEVHERPDGSTVINDAYNANPDSMRAGLRALAAMGEGRRRIAVLGAMLELGPESERMHRDMGELAAGLGIEHLIAVGDGARPIAAGYGDDAIILDDVDAAHDYLVGHLRGGDVVLLKSSRDSGLRYLGDRLVGMEVPC